MSTSSIPRPWQSIGLAKLHERWDDARYSRRDTPEHWCDLVEQLVEAGHELSPSIVRTAAGLRRLRASHRVTAEQWARSVGTPDRLRPTPDTTRDDSEERYP